MATPTTYASEFKAFNGHNYRKNQNAAVDKQGYPCDESACCIICGKYAIRSNKYVFLTNIGEYSDIETGSTQNDALGLYPVGPDCVRKLKGVPVYDYTGKKL